MTSNDDGAEDAATSAGAGPTDETTVVPSPTEAAPALAWSLDEGEDSVPVERHQWGVAWGQAAVFLSIGAVIATVTAVVSWVLIHHDKREPQRGLRPHTVRNTDPVAGVNWQRIGNGDLA